ncbi:MAG: potassium transporter Kup [Acidobacteria bacterium]|nr:potassium transporter Kup [Acidobacteriota bacterium]
MTPRREELAARAEGGEDPAPGGRRLALLCVAALGIVYGDIGTSPLYAIRECFYGEYGIEPSRANVLGVLSLVFWSLLVVVSGKYLTFILRADNHGEGGIIALLALVRPERRTQNRRRLALVAVGLFGASLLYGDGMITPAISVMSAVEGLEVATPVFGPYVVPITVAILAGLFLIQRRGTARIGALFGPVTLIWLLVIAALGLRGLVQEPGVLAALHPVHGLEFLLRNGGRGYLVLGAVFLVVTGTEALYADMGHFGRRPIRLTWYVVVLPSLLLSYFGQAALVLSDPGAAHNPFFNLVPQWALYPLVGLATAATIIASQAVISGAFSLTRQAIQLGYCPRLQIIHTSETERGQIFVPAVNWTLMLATIALVLGFRSSSRLAAAYGVAVTTTMLIATVLFYVVARESWRWPRLAAAAPATLFLVVDLSFFGANVVKIAHGAWFPLAIGLAVFTLLMTWKRGRELLAQRFRAKGLSFERFLEKIEEDAPVRVPGRAVFMTGNPGLVPPALLHNLKHNKVLHEEVVVLTVVTEEIPSVPSGERVEVEALGNGFHRISARYGFMQDPSVPHILAAARSKGLELTVAETSFFLGRERFLTARKGGLPLWREKLFAFMSRNATGATTFFRIPPGQVVEIGEQIPL